MKPVRILIADDHEIVRRGLVACVAASGIYEVCGEASNGRDAVAQAKQLRPDIVIVDVSMPELNGIEATRQIRAELPATEVLVLTMHESDELARDVLAAGARGYVLKNDAGRLLLQALEALSHHKPFFTPRVSELLLSGYLNPEAIRLYEKGASRLSPREREVVQLVAEGKSSKEIASELGISVKTVEAHRGKIMQKLGLRSVSDMVRYAIRNKIVQP